MDEHLDKIFVFGSNESGHHGAGAALFAVNRRGARMHQGFGPAGSSFAIPTKDWKIGNLDLLSINIYINAFIRYANIRPNIKFQVTAIGCGLAGMDEAKISKMFEAAPPNVKLIDDVGKVLCMAKNWHANYTQFGPF